MHNAPGAVTCPGRVRKVLALTSEWQDQRQQPRGIARIFQGPVLLPAELHAGQLQGTVQAQWSFQTPGLGKALLEVHVRYAAQLAVELQALPFL